MRDSTDHLEKTGFTNHLTNESSPYLLQHAHNPVDWYPWSREALDKAKREDKPIFLSIGYAACHWCHVMEKESFEDEAIAGMLNKNFVSIKVDREQRPDLDQIYMAATLSLTGTGGWPMSVFLTPDLKPFFAGTYFPSEDVNGRPGFKHVLSEIAEAYKNERGKIDEFSVALSDLLISALKPKENTAALNKSIIDNGVRDLMDSYDSVCGGFGKAPKFPHPIELSFLLKIYSVSKDPEILRIAEHTLFSMARGGIYDQIGGGFHRYSTDSRWLVPHFEKMLYDNALLAVAYSEAYQITGNEFHRKITQETLDFILRDMSHKQGGFYSSLDADSEGEEGKFYTWTKAEIEQLLKDKSEVFCRYYNISDGGNFENHGNILNLDSSSDKFKERSEFESEEFDRFMAECRMILLAARSKKTSPFTDDKILTSWNGLVISALSKGYQITMNNIYREAAHKAAIFIKDSLMQDGRLIHSYREGKRSDGPFLEDYAYLTAGLIDLYEIAYDYEWIRLASALAKDAIGLFSDENGNLFLSPADQEDHYIRPREIPDGALPAAGSILIQSLLKLADITGENDLLDFAQKSLEALSANIEASPSNMTSALTAVDYLFSDRTELVLVGKENREKFLREIYLRYIPNKIIVVSDYGSENIPLLEGRKTDGKGRALVCRNSVCLIPADNPQELKKQLDEILP